MPLEIEELRLKLLEFERRLTEAEHQLIRINLMLDQGITGAASREINELKNTIAQMRHEAAEIRDKAMRWEGGGSILYIIITVIGASLGWLLSHLTIGGK